MSLLGVLAGNAATATVLGALVAAAALRIRRPALLHALWLAVLVDLLAPPLVRVDLLPDGWLTPSVALPSDTGPGGSASSALAERTSAAVPLGSSVALLWLTGSLTVLGLAIGRGARLARSLRRSDRRSAALEETLALHATRMGISRSPRLRLVAARISPLVMPRLGRVEILVPFELIALLEPRELDAILVHELAHVRRHDAWVRLIELAATVVFWWHPLVYVARSALRRAEEACCDDRVLRALPGHAVDYARSLVKTLEFLSPAHERQPVWATGASPAPSIERRLTMILEHQTSPQLPRGARIGLCCTIVLALAVFPVSRGRTAEAEDEDPAASPAARPDPNSGAVELDQRRAELELERALAEHARVSGMNPAQLERQRQLAQLELERALAEHARASGMNPAQLERQHALAQLELGLARAEHTRARGMEQAQLELERVLAQRDVESARAEAERDAEIRSRRSSTNEIAGLDQDLKRQVEELARRVRELERRMADAPTVE